MYSFFINILSSLLMFIIYLFCYLLGRQSHIEYHEDIESYLCNNIRVYNYKR